MEAQEIPDEVQNVTVRIDGRLFRCSCGCNVFHHPTDEPNVYLCNACEAAYEGVE